MISPVDLRTSRLRLWIPGPDSAEAMARFQEDNDEHFRRWSPLGPASDFHSVPYWQTRLARGQHEFLDGVSAQLAVSWADRDPDRIIGTIHLRDFVRGPLQTCQVGYNLDAREQGKGVMTEGLRATIDLAFGLLSFHRITATYSPLNARSGAVLKRLGFTIEGYARDYLFVNGAWQDHLMAALVNPTSQPPAL